MQINDFKQLPKTSGIYKITNLINGHCYIGQSKNIYNRINNHHIYDYNNPKNDQYDCKIYQAIRKYGWENFDISVIELCPESELNEKEIFYIEKFDSFKNGYNMTEGGTYFSSKMFSPETEQKRAETREKNQSLKGENHPRARLSNKEVINIRYRYKNGESVNQIWEDYKSLYPNLAVFKRIIFGQSYRNIFNPILKEDIISRKGSLSKDEILDIRKKYYIENYSISDIQKLFYIQYSQSTIKAICDRRLYSYIEDNFPNLRTRKNYRLTEDQVKKIRYDYDNKLKTIQQLAEEYKISLSAIKKCVERKTFKDIK